MLMAELGRRRTTFGLPLKRDDLRWSIRRHRASGGSRH